MNRNEGLTYYYSAKCTKEFGRGRTRTKAPSRPCYVECQWFMCEGGKCSCSKGWMIKEDKK